MSTLTFRLPVKFFADSIDYAWDRKGVLFLSVQTNDPTHTTGCAIYKQQADGSFHEVLATGPDGYYKGKLKMKFDGTGWFTACGSDLRVHQWLVPEWSAAP